MSYISCMSISELILVWARPRVDELVWWRSTSNQHYLWNKRWNYVFPWWRPIYNAPKYLRRRDVVQNAWKNSHRSIEKCVLLSDLDGIFSKVCRLLAHRGIVLAKQLSAEFSSSDMSGLIHGCSPSNNSWVMILKLLNSRTEHLMAYRGMHLTHLGLSVLASAQIVDWVEWTLHFDHLFDCDVNVGLLYWCYPPRSLTTFGRGQLLLLLEWR